MRAATLLSCVALAAARHIGGFAPQPLLGRRDTELLRLRGGASRLPATKQAPLTASAAEGDSTKGLLGLLGGVLIHLSCGTMYTWGNLLSYMPLHLKYWSGEAAGKGLPDAQLVLPFILVSQMLGMPLGPLLERLMGPRLTALLGALMMGGGVFLAAGAKTLLQFVLLYSVMFGLGVGIAYQQPFITGARWFPKKKGMVTGAIISGMGASAFLFNLLSTSMINPKKMEAVGGVFPAELYAGWPGLLRKLGLMYAALGVIGALLQSNPPSFTGKYPLLEMIKHAKHSPTASALDQSKSTPAALVPAPKASIATAPQARDPQASTPATSQPQPQPQPQPRLRDEADRRAWQQWVERTGSGRVYHFELQTAGSPLVPTAPSTVAGAMVSATRPEAAQLLLPPPAWAAQQRHRREGEVTPAPTASLAAPPSASLASMVISPTFALMWLMILNSAVSGLNVIGSYKTFGSKQSNLNSDAFLSLVGSLASILGNAAGRFVWGALADVFGFKRPFLALTVLQGLTMIFYRQLASSRITFTIATVTMLFCMGGNFAMFPAQTMRLYGSSGASVYSFLFTAFGAASLLGPRLAGALLKSGGFELVFRVLGGMSFVSFALATAFL